MRVGQRGFVRVMQSVWRVYERVAPTWTRGLIARLASSGGGPESRRKEGKRQSERTESKEPKIIWADYKRNFKGSVPPQKTRIRCRRGPEKIVNNACPICKESISITHTDTNLLNQFLSAHTGEIFESSKTGLCRQQQKKMVAAIEKAWDHGLLPYPIPRKPEDQAFRIPPWNKIDIV